MATESATNFLNALGVTRPPVVGLSLVGIGTKEAGRRDKQVASDCAVDCSAQIACHSGLHYVAILRDVEELLWNKLGISYLDGHPPTANANEDVEVKIKITGQHLQNSEVVVPVESKGKLVAEPDAMIQDGELTQTVRLLKGTNPGSYKLQVKNTNPKAVDLTDKFLVAEAPK